MCLSSGNFSHAFAHWSHDRAQQSHISAACGPPLATIRAAAVHDQLLEFQPHTPSEQIVHAEALRQLNHFLECRRMRLFSVTASLPMSMWYVMILGAVLNITLCWLFDMRLMTHFVLGGIIAAYMGAMMFLIIDMNQPFRGDVAVSAEPFELLYARMNED